MKKNFILPIIFFIITFFVLKKYFNEKSNNIEDNHLYNICKLKSHSYMRGHYMTYIYYVNKKRYEGKYGVKSNCKKMLKKYYIVKYETNNPSNSIVLCDKYITNKEVTIPKEGWTEIPDTITFEKVPDECRCNW